MDRICHDSIRQGNLQPVQICQAVTQTGIIFVVTLPIIKGQVTFNIATTDCHDSPVDITEQLEVRANI